MIDNTGNTTTGTEQDVMIATANILAEAHEQLDTEKEPLDFIGKVILEHAIGYVVFGSRKGGCCCTELYTDIRRNNADNR